MKLQPSNVSYRFRSHKDTNFEAQLKAVAIQFAKHPQTMLQVAHATGIERANICRHIAKLKSSGSIELCFYNHCPITGFRAGFYILKSEYNDK